MKKRMLLPLLPLLLSLGGCGAPYQPPSEGLSSETLSVTPVPDLPEEFILGMDLSSVLSEEESGVRYFDFDGREADVFKLLRDCGFTHIRVRIWNDPYDGEGRGYGGGNSNMLREIIRYYEIPVLTSAALERVEHSEGLTLHLRKTSGEEETVEADSCILSVGYLPDRRFAEALSAAGFPAERTHVIGDAHEVGNLMSVIREAYELCYSL